MLKRAVCSKSIVLHYLLLPCFLFSLQGFASSDSLLTNAFDTFDSLPLLVHGSALEDSVHNFGGIDVRERVFSNLTEQAHGLRIRVGIVCPRKVRDGGAMIYGIDLVWKVGQEMLARGKGSREYEGGYVLSIC